jgi:hypothetical protein
LDPDPGFLFRIRIHNVIESGYNPETDTDPQYCIIDLKNLT